MHPLRRYLNDLEESIQDFGGRVGASRQTLYRIIRGAQAPKPALARRIVEATGGAVSFEALYNGREKSGAAVVALSVGDEESLLDQQRVRMALAVAIDHLSPPDRPGPPKEAVAIAAEAVVNTYMALSSVTSRQGPDRLCQALRPVLEEILREYSGPPPPSALDRGAALATELYYQTWRFDRPDQFAP